jgi:integrase
LPRRRDYGQRNGSPSRNAIDRKERVVYVRRSFTRGELKIPKTEASTRAVPLQARALDALDRINSSGSPLLFPGERGGYLDVHHCRSYQWRPAQKSGGINPIRPVYDLRHTFATFALRAVSTFDLSRYMGASLTMIDRHYGHLARDGREHAIKLLDALNAPEFDPWTLVTLGGYGKHRPASRLKTKAMPKQRQS